MNNLKTTNALLLILVIPLVLYILKLLSFIFIPLVLSMFIALMFLPLMRWLKKIGLPKPVSILIVLSIIIAGLKVGAELIQITSNELLTKDADFYEKAESKLLNIVVIIESYIGIQRTQGENVIAHYFKEFNVINRFGSVFNFIGDTISMTLMTVFFAVLWLSESINFQKLLNTTILKQKHSSIKVFRRIEKDLIKFIIVKVIISMLTGFGFYLACIWFNVSFPIFWGLFAFVINFIQMIGSFISVIALSMFALIDIDATGTLLLLIFVITGVQALMGGVLEPVFMGKSFSINVITILIMLMFWGYLWGVPGLIMSIPITVFIKIVLEQFKSTKVIAELMAGPEMSIGFKNLKKRRFN